MRATAVLGMNYGDEGKGHIVDYLCDEDTLNIRFNGGGQAAHSVVLSDGRSHVFHHWGSGTLQGAQTLLAREVIVNPLIFVTEARELQSKTALKRVLVDGRCMVTTPYDMMINEFHSCCDRRKNTCGVGINETVERSIGWKALSFEKFLSMDSYGMRDFLSEVCFRWVPQRLESLGLSYKEFIDWQMYVLETGLDILTQAFLNLRAEMRERVKIVEDSTAIHIQERMEKPIVFEGAQGLLLDQARTEFFPYLTRSNTGLNNVEAILMELGWSGDDMDVLLVTRPYFTRHGDGPVMNEVDGFPFLGMSEDPTNPENKFQGSMRYGYLDMNWYSKAIKETEAWGHDVGVAITCLDHVPRYWMLPDWTDKVRIESHGPMERDIVEI